MVHHHEERLRAVLPSGFRRIVLGALGRAYPRADWAPHALRAKATIQALAGGGAEGYARALSVVSPELRDTIYGPELVRELGHYRAEQPLVSLLHAAPARSGLDRAQYADFTFGLPGGILTRLDRTSMAVSLELREPLLDHRLAEFAASLPERLRVRGGQGKWLLRRAMRRYLPDEILRRGGQDVAMPIGDWLRGPLAGETQAIAASAALARTGWFDTAQLLRLAEAHRAGRADHSRLLWQLLVLDRSLVRLGLIS
jgi:asparagine synthase (glutamine-hydrolysing)